MRRLLLVSSGLECIKTFVYRDPASMQMLFIPTAGNLDKDTWWIDKDRDVLSKMGFQIIDTDIETASKKDLIENLERADIVYVAGGNTFHLLKIIRETGFDELLTEFVDSLGLYAGASAGALVAGVDISPIASIDEPEKVQGLESTKGLGFVDIVPVPHYNMADRSEAIDDIQRKYRNDYEIVLITDDQAIVVEGDEWKVVDSPRNDLEHEWFTKNHV